MGGVSYPQITARISGNTSGATALISTGTVVLAGGNNITLSQNGNSITVSGPNTAAQSTQPGLQSISAGTTRVTTGEVVLSNSNGISFGVNGNTITASHNALTSQSTGPGGFAAGTQTATSGTVVLSNSNGISFGMSNSSIITASYTVPTVTNSSWTVSDGATSMTIGQLAFTNSNGVTLSLSTGTGGKATVVASHNGLTSQSTAPGAIAAGTQTATSGTIVFSNSNNVSFGLSGSTRITASASYSQSTAPGAFAAGTQTATSGTVIFSNSNGISFGMSNSSIVTASYTVPTQSAQTIGLYASSNTTGQSSSTTIDARTLSVRGAGIVSVGYSGGELIVSASAAGAADGYNILAAGTQTAGTATSVKFADSNGISFGMSNSSQITASYTVPAVTNSSMTISDSATSGTLARLALTNLNGVTLSLSTGAGGSHTIVGSHNAITSQSNQAFSASGGSSAFQTLNFTNSNGFTFSNTNGSVVGSYTVPTQSAQTIGVYFLNNTTGQSSSSTVDARSLSFSAMGEVSAGMSGGNIVLSANLDSLSAYAAGNTTQSSSGGLSVNSLILRGAGNVSVGVSNGSVVFSGGTAAASPVNFSAGAAANDLGSVVFSNSNGVSFGLNGSTITASVNAGGGGGIYAGMSDQGGTAGQSGTISSGNLVFVGNNGINLSQTIGTDGNNATITFQGQGLSYCASQFPKQPPPMATSSAFSGSSTTTAGGSRTTFSYYISPFVVDDYVTFNKVFANVSFVTVAGTYSQSYAHMYALYSKVGETLSTHMTFGAGMVWSQNSVTAVTGNWWWGSNSTSNSSQTSGNVSASFGNRLNALLLYTGNSSLTPGHYWLAYAYSGISTQSSAGQSAMFASMSQSTMGSMMGTNVSSKIYPNLGIVSTVYSTDSANQFYFPSEISTSAITGTGGSSQNRSNVLFFVSN